MLDARTSDSPRPRTYDHKPTCDGSKSFRIRHLCAPRSKQFAFAFLLRMDAVIHSLFHGKDPSRVRRVDAQTDVVAIELDPLEATPCPTATKIGHDAFLHGEARTSDEPPPMTSPPPENQPVSKRLSRKGRSRCHQIHAPARFSYFPSAGLSNSI